MMLRTFTFRLPTDDLEALRAMSVLADKPMGQLSREAVETKISRFSVSDAAELCEADLRARQEAFELLMRRRTVAS